MPPGVRSAFSSAYRKRPVGVTPALEQSILTDVANAAGGTIGRLGYALDTPGAGVRSAMVGRPDLWMADADERVSGRDVLRHYGLASKEDDWANWAAGLALEVATDPLSMLSGPMAALRPAGKAAKAAGLLDDAGRAISRKVQSGAAVAPEVASRASGRVAQLTKDGRRITDNDFYTKPLLGPRAARRYGTLEDVVKYADDPQSAMDKVVVALGKGDAQAGKKAYDELKNQALGGDVGIGLPLMDSSAVFNVGGAGARYGDAMDALGSAVRWSLPGRVASALGSKSVDGAVEAEQQMLNAAAFAKRKEAKAAAVRESARQLSRLNSRAPETFSEDGGRALGRLIEGFTENDDVAMMTANPAIREYVDWWKQVREDVLTDSKVEGLSSKRLDDPYGVQYLPYQADSMFELASRGNSKLRNSLSTMTGDQMQRGATLRLPGGRDQIMELSQDKMVSGGTRKIQSEVAAANYLAEKVFQGRYSQLPPKQQKQMRKLARLLANLPDEATAIAPLFGQHPTQMIQQYLSGRAEAAANLDTVYDSIVSFVKQGRPAYLGGQGHVSVSQALRNIGAKTVKENGIEIGARQQMRQRLAKALGVPADKVDLNKISIPRDHMDRLTRAQRVFDSPQASSELVQWLDSVTSVWKGSILAWPSRIVRDLYSGQYANWLAGAFSPRSAMASKVLMSEGADSQAFSAYLNALPQYASIADPIEKAAAFNADLVSTGLLSGGTQLDRAGTTTGRTVLDQIPGANPATWIKGEESVAGEFFNVENWKTIFSRDSVRSPLNKYGEVTNPMLRAGDKANTLSDGINRLSGYYALLEQGMSPQAAAEQIKRVQVDYGSLSDFERSTMRRIFPWYTYQSRIFQEVVGQMATRPGGRYAQTIRAANSSQQNAGDDYIPSYMREQIALPVADLPSGKLYLRDFDLAGFDQINMFAPTGSGSDAVMSTLQQFGEQLAPQYRVATELLSGRDLYHDRPIDENPSGIVSNLYRRTVGGEPGAIGYIGDRIIGNVPFVQRPSQFISKLVDDRSGASVGQRALAAGVDALTGVKASVVDQQQIDSDLRRLIESSISALPESMTMERTYIPEELQPNIPEWAQQRIALLKELDRRRRAASR